MQQRHFISHPDQTGDPQSRITQIVPYTRALRCSFSSAIKKSQWSLHWDCIPFFVKCNQSDDQSTQTKPQNAEQNHREPTQAVSLVVCSKCKEMYGRILKSYIVNLYRGMAKLKLKINVTYFSCCVLSILWFEWFGRFRVDCYYTL